LKKPAAAALTIIPLGHGARLRAERLLAGLGLLLSPLFVSGGVAIACGNPTRVAARTSQRKD